MTALVALVGPTASGKTAVAIELAERLGTEIVSADSMQFYRGMSIGTGAPTAAEQMRVRHHFTGFLEAREEFSAGAFETLARECVAALNARGKITVVVGGSGLYVRALIDGLFAGPAKDPALRGALALEAETFGVPALYERLCAADPEYAARIQRNDLRRIVRALEVRALTGKPLGELHREHRAHRAPLDAIQIALDWPREELYARIDRRVDRMIAQGLLEEVQTLIDQGYGNELERLRSLGYREMANHLLGKSSIDEAAAAMKQNTRRYAKRQLTWFRHDPRIVWLPAADRTPQELAAQCQEIIGAHSVSEKARSGQGT